MIRQAIGINKDGPTYATFSNVFCLGGQGNAALGIAAEGNTSTRKQNNMRARGTTQSDPNKAKNDMILSQFKSKILQNMNENLRNTGTG